MRDDSTAGTGTRLMYMTIGYFLHFMLHHRGVAKRLAAAYKQEAACATGGPNETAMRHPARFGTSALALPRWYTGRSGGALGLR